MALANTKQNEPISTYREEKIGKTLYRITNVYNGKIDFTKAMEDLIVRIIIREEGKHTICSDNKSMKPHGVGGLENGKIQ